jgi:hypothetical protein
MSGKTLPQHGLTFDKILPPPQKASSKIHHLIKSPRKLLILNGIVQAF